MQFAKMHALGNDFVIVDSINQTVCLTIDKIRFLSNRYYGIGFNQLLVLESSCDSSVDFYCRIYNADGSEVNQCGNGIRCVARFIYMKKLTNKNNIIISTRTDNMKIALINEDQILVNMGKPIFDPGLIPFYASDYKKVYILFVPIQKAILCGVVSMGNPHCIVLSETVEKVDVLNLGSFLERHHYFPNKVNVSFMQIISNIHIKLRVYERGVGETQACGSAACAAVAVGIQQELLKSKRPVQVDLPGGKLLISWSGMGHSLYMMGSTSYIYDGCIDV